jgi:hypothetical protein
MGATSDNYLISTDGVTYEIASIYSAGLTGHIQYTQVYGGTLSVGNTVGVTFSDVVVGNTVGVTFGTASVTFGTVDVNVIGVTSSAVFGITVGSINIGNTVGVTGSVDVGTVSGTVGVTFGSVVVGNTVGVVFGKVSGTTIDYITQIGSIFAPVTVTFDDIFANLVGVTFTAVQISNTVGVTGTVNVGTVGSTLGVTLGTVNVGTVGGTVGVTFSDVIIGNTVGVLIGNTLDIGVTFGTVNIGTVGSTVGVTFGNVVIGNTVGVTFGNVVIGNTVGITVGTVDVTFGTVNIRGLTSASDTITVYGGGTASTVSVGLFGFTGATASPIYTENNALNVNIKAVSGTLDFSSTVGGITVSATDLDIRNLDYTSDSVEVVGQGAADDAALSTVPTYLTARAANGSLYRVGGITGAGWSYAAINTYLVNSGFSFTAQVTLGAAVGISQEYNNPIQVAGSTYAATGIWVAGDTANGPVLVKGYSGGLLPVDLQSSTLVTQSNFDTKIAQLKTNSDFLIATKKALYDSSVSVGALDFNDSLSIYTLIKNAVNTQLQTLANTVNASSGTIGVAVEAYTLQPSFMARTNYVSNTAKNLTEYNGNAGFTCANGIRIKVSRVATGTNASQNEIMCVISEADAAVYGATAGTASYTMYHGDEMFFEVDNINKIKVFYPPYSASLAPHNTGSGITFSFYAS